MTPSSSLGFTLLKRDACSKPRQHVEPLGICAKLADELTRKQREWLLVGFLLSLFLLVQACLAVTEYSGYNKPPMHGDFEAQRHWMELTVNLPASEWYFYDLDYWGLDYPPLTAYHSWLLGKISERLNGSWVELRESRGIEQLEHKLFMRLSVIVSMLAVYAPALICLFRSEWERHRNEQQNNRQQQKQAVEQFSLLAEALLYPGLLFVDCAHFQYNHFSLGLFLWALFAFQSENFSVGSLFFVLALNHKQMELYHALSIAVFLLARSIRKSSNIWLSIGQSLLNLSKLAVVVLGIFALLWLPFLLSGPATVQQVLRRLFPVGRGLFEDKVANFWCCASILIKFKQLYSASSLFMASTLLVVITSAPTLICLFLRPNWANFRLALVSCALSFFLFSFQVHEKSILLVAIPALLLLNDKKWQRPTRHFLSISNFSLYPLCLKDGVPEMLPMFIFYQLHAVWSNHSADELQSKLPRTNFSKNKLLGCLELLALPITPILCLLQLFVRPPIKYPHLFQLLNALVSFGCFLCFWIWINAHLLTSNWKVWLEQQKIGGKKQK